MALRAASIARRSGEGSDLSEDGLEGIDRGLWQIDAHADLTVTEGYGAVAPDVGEPVALEIDGADQGLLCGGGIMMAAAPAAVEEVEEKTQFNVMLDEVPADKKIAVLKVVRTLTGLGLKEAKELVESTPKIVQEAVSKDTAEDAKKQIEDAGGKVSLT